MKPDAAVYRNTPPVRSVTEPLEGCAMETKETASPSGSESLAKSDATVKDTELPDSTCKRSSPATGARFGRSGKGSTASSMPSPSVSLLSGLVPIATSRPSESPSPSVSVLNGSVPRAISSPSLSPSPSVSGFAGLVPAVRSPPLDRPSLSKSSASALAVNGSIPRSLSKPLFQPSSSSSASRGRRSRRTGGWS